MDKSGFGDFLQTRELSEDQIEQSMLIVEKFESFVEELDRARTLKTSTTEDIRAFMAILIKENSNSYDNFLALARYAYFVENVDVYLAILELIDGGNVMDVLYENLGKLVGEERRAEVFEGIELPPLGMPSTEKIKVTKAVIDRMEDLLDPVTCKRALSDTAHGIPRDYYLQEREKYLEAKDIDEYLETRRQNFIVQLEEHRDEGTLFFNQEITNDVIDFIRNNPGIGSAVRRGNTLYHTKIPYLTKEYLVETDERMKRYYGCYCPWAREAIMTDDVDVSPTFCHCSAGFTKQPLEMALDQPLEIELVESILKGDLRCTFTMQLPKEMLDKIEE